MALAAKVLTVSDSAHAGTRADRSGPSLRSYLVDHGFDVPALEVVPDGVEAVGEAIRRLANGFWGLLVTTGGTGFAPTDHTPEATRSVIDRQAPGLAEAIRAASPLGPLSRGVAGTLGACLIVNLPGSPTGALESISSVIDVLPHALELLGGGRPHPG
jgi:molybdenum cofactor synthesis domain-containing protein